MTLAGSVKVFLDPKVTALHANGAFHAGLYKVLTRILMYSKFITLIITFALLKNTFTESTKAL